MFLGFFYTRQRPSDEALFSSLSQMGIAASSVVWQKEWGDDAEISDFEGKTILNVIEEDGTGFHFFILVRSIKDGDTFFNEETVEDDCMTFAKSLAKNSGLDVVIDSGDYNPKVSPEGILTRVDLDDDTREVVWESEIQMLF